MGRARSTAILKASMKVSSSSSVRAVRSIPIFLYCLSIEKKIESPGSVGVSSAMSVLLTDGGFFRTRRVIPAMCARATMCLPIILTEPVGGRRNPGVQVPPLLNDSPFTRPLQSSTLVAGSTVRLGREVRISCAARFTQPRDDPRLHNLLSILPFSEHHSLDYHQFRTGDLIAARTSLVRVVRH